MKYKDAIIKIKKVNYLYENIVESICRKLLEDESVNSEVISNSDSMTFRFSSDNNISIDIYFDFTDVRVSFFLFEANDNKVNKFHEVTDSYINNEIEAKDLNDYLIELLSNPIKIVSIRNVKRDILLKKHIEYTSIIDGNQKITKGYLVNRIIFPWQKTKIDTKVFEPWIKTL